MPAVRKPTAILEASGAFENHPSRRRPREPNSGRGVGPAPEWLAEDERRAWDQIVGDCAAGVFQSSDRVFLEQLARLLAKSRRRSDGSGVNAVGLILQMLSRCGMTPADRSKVVVVKADEPERPKTGLAAFR